MFQETSQQHLPLENKCRRLESRKQIFLLGEDEKESFLKYS
jgi:hypothetical protein